MADTVSVTARIPAEDKDRLAALANATGRTRGVLISMAIRDYLEKQAWQIEETQNAISEAEAGDFATDEETDAFFAKWRA